MSAALIGPIIRLLFPKAPAWLSALLLEAVPVIVDAVEELRNTSAIRGPEKRALVVETVRDALDDGMDQIPEWSKLTEARRDAILGGMAELALFVLEVSDRDGDGDVTTREVRKSLRGVKASIRSAIASAGQV